jgi:hypothetical protein
MNEEINFWRCVAGAFMVLVVSVASCTAHQNYIEGQVVAKSANPAATECAFSGSDKQHSAFCVEVAKQK